MRNVIAIGEIVYDIIFKNNAIQASRAGGSVLNSSVSLAKLGIHVELLSVVGSDQLGFYILDFLNQKGVDTSSMFVSPDLTSIAIAWLDENNNATYSFYKKDFNCDNLKFKSVSDDDVFLFGSMFSLQNSSRMLIHKYIDAISVTNGLIFYDPNIRLKNKTLADMQNTVIGYMKIADIVRASDEDMMALTKLQNPEDILNYTEFHNFKVFILTCGAKGVWVKTQGFKKFYPTPSIAPLSTIGAGDTFNAGIIEGLIKRNIYKSDLPTISISTWDEIIERAMSYAAQVCLSFDNYLVS